MSLRVVVLGPVRAWTGDAEAKLGSPQQRLVLAALALAQGRTLSLAQLADVLWGAAEPPRSAVGVIRTHVSRLRAVLGRASVVSAGDGYALGPASTDVDDFDAHTAGGRLREALDLWEGEALAGLPGEYATGRRVWLAEQRTAVLESLLEDEVRRGRHAECLAELTALRAEYPLRERLTGLLMRALHAAGRQAEAAGVYADTRRLLDEQLGVEPSRTLAETYREIVAAAPVPAPEAQRPVPAQLPAAVTDFTGRAALVEELTRALRPGAALAISALSGLGGIGKTALAVHVAHRVRAHFPDGQLFTDLRGAGPDPADPAEVLAGFVRALGVEEVPDGLEERSALFRTLLAERRVLLLLDNAAGAAHLSHLLPGAPSCAVVTTSRVRPSGLAGARQFALDVLEPGEALDLLTAIVGRDRIAAEPDAARALVAACGQLPLAVRIAAARLSARPSWPVSLLVERLADERRRLVELRVGDLALESVFALSYDQLSPAQARAFRLLALPDGPDLPAPAAVDLIGPGAEDWCEDLVDLGLAESPAPGRYRMHDLLRVFGRARLGERERAEGLARLLDFHLATLRNVHRAVRGGESAQQLAEITATGRPLADRPAGRAWLAAETPGLASVLAQAAAEPGARTDVLAEVASLLASQMDGVVQASLVIPAVRAVAAAAGRRDEPASCLARAALGHLLRDSGEMDEAAPHLRAALDLARRHGRADAFLDVSNTLGLDAYYAGDYDRAGELLRESIAFGRRSGLPSDLATASLNLALVHIETGDTAEAIRLARYALPLSADQNLRTFALYTLARALGDAPEAVARYRECADVSRENALGFRTAAALFRLAELHLAADPAQAATLAEQSLAESETLENPHIRGDALAVLGRALVALRQPARGRVCLEEAAAVFTRLGLPKADDVRAVLDGLG
ncbi:BTAD domain-containing putative transcriptional regulator [Nonomuraea sp. NPDC049152]|uniref:AfsR/SARP family transcriptional regulator n=1 Tax=Nonomuraea sp. NPDC049152 TaxID=3154350 RepID=UPI0033D22DC9